jgi:predicted  nucleic acid-binding Zn ribbon protein
MYTVTPAQLFDNVNILGDDRTPDQAGINEEDSVHIACTQCTRSVNNVHSDPRSPV